MKLLILFNLTARSNEHHNLTHSSNGEFRDIISGELSKLIDNDYCLPLKQISSISSFQNPDSKQSWLAGILKSGLYTPQSKIRDLSFSKGNMSNDSPMNRLGLDSRRISQLKQNLIDMSVDKSNEIFHFSNNSNCNE